MREKLHAAAERGALFRSAQRDGPREGQAEAVPPGRFAAQAGGTRVGLSGWAAAMRLWSLTASVIPIVIGTAAAWPRHAFRPGLFALALTGGALLHLGTNLLNTYGDYVSGVDTPESAPDQPFLTRGLIRPTRMRRVALALFALAACAGAWLTVCQGWLIAVFGLIGLAGGYGYTTGLWPYKYKGYGPLGVFWLMGPCMVAPAYYAQTGVLDWRPFLIALPVSFLVSAIIHANDLRDLEHDRRAGVLSLAMRLGWKTGMRAYVGLVLAAYASLAALVLAGIAPVTALLPFLAAPLLYKTLAPLQGPECAEHLKRLDARSAQLHFVFGLLLIAGLLLPQLARTA